MLTEEASIRTIPIVGTISEALQCIYTTHQRSDVASSISGSQQIVNRQQDQYDNNSELFEWPNLFTETFLKLVVFPEGTTTNNKFISKVPHCHKTNWNSSFPQRSFHWRVSCTTGCNEVLAALLVTNPVDTTIQIFVQPGRLFLLTCTSFEC